ncbi:MAG TPA: RIP metalloprotease RseP [Gemmatimonadaceae bacterium]|jgi:regulator of sigma E protease|nr:RIP metalloprotease RseP [Gemmatimonadaceae bacterium]
MSDLLTGTAGTIFVLGLVIFVHELGHFLAAKWAGVYAPRFSIGFGPALWSRKWGETEYILAAVPLGGYVRMASREDETMALIEGGGEQPVPEPETVGGSGTQVLPDEATRPKRTRYWDPQGMAPFGPRPVPAERHFESKPLAKRLVIMFAGVTMNILLGFVILTGVVLNAGDVTLRTRVIDEVAPALAPSLDGQLSPGDTILAVDGHTVESWNDVADRIREGEGSPVVLRTNRGEQRITVEGRGAPSRDELPLGLRPRFGPVLGNVQPGRAADRAGLRQGDSVVAVNGVAVSTWDQLVEHIRRSPGRDLTFAVVRDGQPLTIDARPDSVRDVNPETQRREYRGLLGVEPYTERSPIGVGPAVALGWERTWEMAGTVVTILRRLVTREVPLSQLSGPIGIARASAEAAQMGMEPLLLLVALLSINLAVFNLLPIPILDGGQILLNVIESIKGSALSARTREYALRFGLLAIAMLLVLVMFNDIKNLFGL